MVGNDELSEIARKFEVADKNIKYFGELFKVLDGRMQDKYRSHLVAVCENLGRNTYNN